MVQNSPDPAGADAAGAPEDVRNYYYELTEAVGPEKGCEDALWQQAEVMATKRGDVKVPAPTSRRFLILVRHARRAHVAAMPEDKHRMDGWAAGQPPASRVEDDEGKPRKSGWRKTVSIATALAEQLAVEDIKVTHVLHSTHKVARQTALVYAAVLCRLGTSVLDDPDWLKPEEFRKQNRRSIDEQLNGLWERSHGNPRSGEGRAIILVGHQPQLTEIADIALRGAPSWWQVWLWRRRLRKPMPLPVGSSEAACLRVGRSPRLRWLLTEKGSPLAAEIKDKLRSKVDTAKFFLGALAVNAAILVNTNIWSTAGQGQVMVLGIGAWLVFAGLLFAIATLLAYDALNMPPEFWSEGAHLGGRRQKRSVDVDPPSRSVLRPPSEATVLLFYEMVKLWNRFFLPALVFSVAGVSCFLLTLGMSRMDSLLAIEEAGSLVASPPPAPVASPCPPAPTPPLMQVELWIDAALVLLLSALIAGMFYRRAGQKLGLED